MVFAIQKANLVEIQSSRFWWYSFVFERTQSRLVIINIMPNGGGGGGGNRLKWLTQIPADMLIMSVSYLGGLRVTKPLIRLACLSVCLSVRLSVRQHFACKHDNSTNINRIGPKLIPWMYLKSALVKFEDGWPWPIFEVTGVNLNMKICNFRL